MRRASRSAALIVAATVTGCAEATPDADPAELMEADRAFARAVAAGGAEAWAGYFDVEGIQLVPGGRVEGRTRIREVMEPLFADSTYSVSWEPEHAEIASSGDFGFTVGRYVSVRRDSAGNEVRATGSYTTVWRRDAEGNWKVLLDGGTPDP